MKTVEIEWVDAISYSNMWVARDSKESLALCRSVGYLVKKNKEKVVIAQSSASDGDVMNKFVIPRGCIKKITELK